MSYKQGKTNKQVKEKLKGSGDGFSQPESSKQDENLQEGPQTDLKSEEKIKPGTSGKQFRYIEILDLLLSKKKAIEESKDEITSKYTSLLLEHEALVEAYKSLGTTATEQEHNMEEISKENIRLNQYIKQVEDNHADEINKLRTEMHKQSGAHDRVQNLYTRLHKDYEDNQGELQRTTTTLSEARESIQRKEAQLDKFESQMQKTISRNEELIKENRKITQENEELQKQVDDIHIEMNRLKQQSTIKTTPNTTQPNLL